MLAKGATGADQISNPTTCLAWSGQLDLHILVEFDIYDIVWYWTMLLQDWRPACSGWDRIDLNKIDTDE